MANVVLNREKIIAAGITAADRDGLSAVSMRRIAEQLGSGTMSLYRHVDGKDDLVTAMVDTVAGHYTYPDATGLDWRERMHLMARQDWQMYLDHPWVLTTVSTMMPPFGPEALKGMEWALEALEPLGLSPEACGRAIMTVNNYLQGAARTALGGDRGKDDPGLNWQTRLSAEALTEYPRLRELISTELGPRDTPWFTSGLDLILDGIAAAK